MANKKSNETASESKEAVQRKQRVGIIMKKFIDTKDYSPSNPYKHFKPYHAGQVIFLESEIDHLLSIDAPIKVFIEDGSN